MACFCTSVTARVDVSVFIVNLMAIIRTITTVPGTYEDLTFILIKMIASGFNSRTINQIS